MTDPANQYPWSEPADPLDRPRPGGLPLAAIFLWAIIITAVVTIAMLQYAQRTLGADAAGPADVQRVNVGLRVMGRYAVGIGRLGMAPPPAAGTASGNMGAAMVPQIDELAESTVDRIRTVPIIAELVDNEAALQRLAGLTNSAELDDELRRDIEALTTIYETGRESLTPDERQRLIDRHRWFAQLATTHGMPPTSPERRQAIAPAMRVVVVLLVAFVGILVVGLASLALFITGIVLLSMGKLRLKHVAGAPAGREAPTALLETLAVFLLGFLGLSLVFGLLSAATGADLTWLLFFALPLAMFWPLLRGMSWSQLRDTLGWRRGGGVFAETGLGIVGYLAGIPLLFVAVVVVLVLTALLQQEPPAHPLVEELGTGGWGAVRLYLLACVWAPLVEETIFRGALYHHLRRRHRIVISAVIVGVIFAAIHPQGLTALPALMTLGAVFALLREWRGSLIGSIAAHAFNNAVAVTLILLLLAD